MSEPNFDTFIEELKAAPSFVKENVMCYFYHNSSACTKCHKENCKAREPREIPPAIDELTQSDKMEAYRFLVRIGEYRTFSIPNPNRNYALFCNVIRDIATGKYMKEIEEVVIKPELDERTRIRIEGLRSLPHAKHSDDDDALALAMAGERYCKEFEMQPVLSAESLNRNRRYINPKVAKKAYEDAIKRIAEGDDDDTLGIFKHWDD